MSADITSSPIQTLKLLVIGSDYCGKTTFIKRVVTGKFLTDLTSTLGVENHRKEIVWDRDTCILLDFWDVGGHDGFAPMLKFYVKDADGAFLFFDLSRPKTFAGMENWLKKLDDTAQLLNIKRPIPIVLVGNKQDIQVEDDLFYPRYLWNYCDKKGLVGYQLTSIKNNYNIDQAINMMVERSLADRAAAGLKINMMVERSLADQVAEGLKTSILRRNNSTIYLGAGQSKLGSMEDLRMMLHDDRPGSSDGGGNQPRRQRHRRCCLIM